MLTWKNFSSPGHFPNDYPRFVDAVKNLDRPNLIMAGLLTDVCLFHSVVSAVEAGYNVYVVGDASGTTTELADTVTYQRLRDFGAAITTTYGVLFEMYSDLSTAEGQKAQGIDVVNRLSCFHPFLNSSNS